MNHWTIKYLSIPFSPFGCGEFVEKVLKEEFGCDYIFPKSSSCLKKDPEIIKNFISSNLIETKNPKDGDIVLLNGDRLTCHVGVYVSLSNRDYVLHSERRIKVSCLHRVTELGTYGYFNARYFTWQK